MRIVGIDDAPHSFFKEHEASGGNLHAQALWEPTDPDVLAFHEAFADIVALMQHFTFPEALLDQVAKVRGDLRAESLLGQLAVQFGQATGRHGALRDAIGSLKDGRWAPQEPGVKDYTKARASHSPHALGALLVAAVFDAFLQIYEHRTRDLLRLATGGTGVLPPGAIHPELADRLSREAAKTAGHVLTICIRALDYCPPVDITFGDYLRALITADRDIVPADERSYRVAFVEAFRRRGIYPEGVRSLAEESLLWDVPELCPTRGALNRLMRKMSLDWKVGCDRHKAFDLARRNAATLHKWLMEGQTVTDSFIRSLGLERQRIGPSVPINGRQGTLSRLEVHSVRPARRVGPDGQSRLDLIVEITQRWTPATSPDLGIRGGCTILIGLEEETFRYVVRKRVTRPDRIERVMQHLDEPGGAALTNPYGSQPLVSNLFALLHRD